MPVVFFSAQAIIVLHRLLLKCFSIRQKKILNSLYAISNEMMWYNLYYILFLCWENELCWTFCSIFNFVFIQIHFITLSRGYSVYKRIICYGTSFEEYVAEEESISKTSFTKPIRYRKMADGITSPPPSTKCNNKWSSSHCR